MSTNMVVILLELAFLRGRKKEKGKKRREKRKERRDITSW